MTDNLPPLLPCPFCESSRLEISINGHLSMFVECHDCGASGPVDVDYSTASTVWNDRAALAQSQSCVPAVTRIHTAVTSCADCPACVYESDSRYSCERAGYRKFEQRGATHDTPEWCPLPIAASPQPQPVQPSEQQYLCKAWGETDLPAAAIVSGLDGVRAFLVEQWLGDADHEHNDGTKALPEAMADMQTYWETEGECWSAEFEIGGVSVQKVFHAAPSTVAQAKPEQAAQPNLLSWAVDQWLAEVSNRPLVNKNRRTLDDTWRQVIRFAGGEPDELIGPCHDTLLAAAPQPKD